MLGCSSQRGRMIDSQRQHRTKHSSMASDIIEGDPGERKSDLAKETDIMKGNGKILINHI